MKLFHVQSKKESQKHLFQKTTMYKEYSLKQISEENHLGLEKKEKKSMAVCATGIFTMCFGSIAADPFLKSSFIPIATNTTTRGAGMILIKPFFTGVMKSSQHFLTKKKLMMVVIKQIRSLDGSVTGMNYFNMVFLQVSSFLAELM